MRYLVMSLALLLSGCLGPTNIAWRGVISSNTQTASTSGVIGENKNGGDSNVEADKQYSDMLKDNNLNKDKEQQK